MNQEKNSVKIQTQKLNILRGEFGYLNAQNIKNEKENENLIHKLATLTLKMQEMEELMRLKDDKIDELVSLQNLRDTLVVEVDNLKSNRELLFKTLKDKNEEIERLKVSGIRSYTLHHNNKCLVREGAKDSNTLNKSAGLLNSEIYDESRQELIGALSEKLDLIHDKATRKAFQEILNKLLVANQSPYKSNNVSMEKTIEDATNEMTQVRKEFFAEQEKNIKLKQDYDQLTKNYDKHLKVHVLNFDEIKQKIINDAAIQERLKYEKEKSYLMKDLQLKVDKVFYKYEL